MNGTRAWIVGILVIHAALPADRTWADSWAVPKEEDFISTNGRFGVHVVTAKEETPCTADVFRFDDGEKTPLWRVELSHEGTPAHVYVTDDGAYLVTVDEINSHNHGGMGPFVLAFYNPDGLIKNYSLEEILHYPDRIDITTFNRLVTFSTAGRDWSSWLRVFDEHQSRRVFCIWLDKGKRWLGWDVTTGMEIEATDDHTARWDSLGRDWARREMNGERHCYTAVEFLAARGLERDRPMIETWLSNKDFVTNSQCRVFKDKASGQHVWQLTRLVCRSHKRLSAEQALRAMDARIADKNSTVRPRTGYFGAVWGKVLLPEGTNPRAGILWVHLMPGEPGSGSSSDMSDVQRLAVNLAQFERYGPEPGRENEISFVIETVKPGKYRMHAVLDAKPPHTNLNRPVCKPTMGDYHSDGEISVSVIAGKHVRDIVIPCTCEAEAGQEKLKRAEGRKSTVATGTL